VNLSDCVHERDLSQACSGFSENNQYGKFRNYQLRNL